MSASDAIARAVLYEGYALYPYRPSSLKNQQRFPFGGLYPEAWSAARRGAEPWRAGAQVLLRAGEATSVRGVVRFLQLRDTGGVQQAVEREVPLPRLCPLELLGAPWRCAFSFEASAVAESGAPTPFTSSVAPQARSREAAATFEAASSGLELVAAPRLRAYGATLGVNGGVGLRGEVELSASVVDGQTVRLSATVRNLTPMSEVDEWHRARALLRCLCSLHVGLLVEDGEFLSAAEPPPALEDAARACRSEGLWPVLVGREGRGEELLCSPILLGDYPRVAPESRGDLFDGTEIDEILTLRILTLTDAEKREARAADPKVAALLDRVEALGVQDVRGLHGARRDRGLPAVKLGATLVRPGDKVRLRPGKGGESLDVVLAGKVATVESIEVDFEDRPHLAVTVDEDPGADLGRLGQPGHRFFFHPHEVEPL